MDLRCWNDDQQNQVFISAYRLPLRSLAQGFRANIGTQFWGQILAALVPGELGQTGGKYLVEVAAYYNILP